MLLNKDDAPATFDLDELQPGTWRAALDGNALEVGRDGQARRTVPAHDAAVFVLDAPVRNAGLRERLDQARAGAHPDD